MRRMSIRIIDLVSVGLVPDGTNNWPATRDHSKPAEIPSLDPPPPAADRGWGFRLGRRMPLVASSCRSRRGKPGGSERATRTDAFTLLEVILTLAMSVALMLLIGAAMQFYGRTMNVRDMDIRQIQLASALLQMIEDDLRATLYTRPVDTAGLEAMLAASGGKELGSDEDLSAAGIDSGDDPADDLMTDTTILKNPGLIGNQYQVQVDLSRLPRLEEYTAMIDGTTSDVQDVPSDIKTVSYYVQGAGVIGGVLDSVESLDANSSAVAAGGLVRRSLDRAASVEASLTGGISRLNQTGELIAPEVVGI